MSSLEVKAVQRAVADAMAAGVEIPGELLDIAKGFDCSTTGGGLAWVRAHPEYLADDGPIHGCCDGEVYRGPEGCYCWEPEYDLAQADPVPDPAATGPTGVMCHDCAYRPGSPERGQAYTSEALMSLPADGAPFWCHQGMRRPVRWRHPDGRVVDGDPADYQPPMVDGVPYQADGSPGRLCSGWAAIRLARQVTREVPASTASSTDA